MPSKETNKPWEYILRKYLLLLATVVATVTYAAGFNPPGGVWQDTDASHLAGDPIILGTHHSRYMVFFVCNAIAFASSLVVIVLILLLALLHGKKGITVVPLRVVMVLDLLSIMGAYAAGTCRDTLATIYYSMLVTVVFAFPVVLSVLVSSSKDEPVDKKVRKVLMLLATFMVSVTYMAGLSTPGGFWDSTQDGHHAGDAVLQELHPGRLRAFFVCNTTVFVASLLIIVLLLSNKLRSQVTVLHCELYGCIILALIGLVGAYASGSTREAHSTIYVGLLVGAVLACILLVATVVRYTTATPIPEDRQEQNRNEQALEKARSLVLLLATLAATVTYQAGLDPPGGFWQDDGDGYKAGDPILLTTNPRRYKVFFFCNSTAFVASLVAIILVERKFFHKSHMQLVTLAAMILDLFGLIGAYAAGSCRDVSTSIYVIALAGAVLVYVVIHIVFFTLDHRDNRQDADELDNRREVLLLLAILAATLTYQAGLTPPGGFWSADDKFGHHAGFPVLLDNYPDRYKAFFYCNATSFMASVALIVLLVNPNLYRPGIRCYALYVCMVAGMFGLMGAYAAGSSRHLRTSIYVLTLVAAVFALVTLQVVVFWIRNRRNKTSKSGAHQTGNGSPGQESGSDSFFETGAHGTGKESSGKGDGRNAPSEPVPSDTGKGSSAQGGKSNSNASSEREDHDTENESSGSGDKDLGEYLMLIGVLAASVTYQTGLKPPGGLWQDNGSGHSAGNSILHDIDKRRYHAFFYSNSTSFMASIVVIVLLLQRMLHDNTLPLWPMHTAILLDMLGLLGAYAAGSTREWETSRNVIALVVPVLAYIAAYAAVSFFRKKGRCHKGNSASTTPQ